MTSTGAVVLAYRPGPGILENIARLREQSEHVYVVNNSPDDSGTAVILDPLRGTRDVSVLDQVGNVGVAAGFNAGMRAALEDGHDFVWIFDQDSTAAPGMLEHLKHAFGQGNVAIAGPALRAEETGFLYDADHGEGVVEVPTLISSGALFSRAALKEVGLHDERLFIDYVDHDISLRARRAGYAVVKVFGTVLDHRFGASTASTFLGRRIYLSNYSPMRQYYMTRNRVIMVRRYGVGRWFWEDFAYAGKAWIKVLLCEHDRGPKIRASLRGLLAGVRFREVHSLVV